MKKNLLLVTASLVALSAAAPAVAADLAARPYTKAPAMVATIYDWSGFYIGINGGGGSSHATWNLLNVGREGSHDATGGTVGGQIGYRWQAGQWVFGVEGQGNWADFSGSNTSALAINALNTNRTKIDSFGLITGQVGYAWNNVLVYVKGGAAVVGDKYDVRTTAGGAFVASSNATRWGGTIGAGLEYGFAPNWSVGVEYNHIFIGSNNQTLTNGGAFVQTDSIKQDVDMGLVRLNYKFGGPIIAKY